MKNKIIGQQVKWDYETNTGLFIQQFSDGSLLCEPVTSEEAAKLSAEINGY